MIDHEPFTSYRSEFRPVRFTPTPFAKIDVARLLGVSPVNRRLLVSQIVNGSGHGNLRRLEDRYGPIGLIGRGKDTPVGMFEIGLDFCEPLSKWAPTTSEVGAIIDLARSVAPQKQRPVILDLECGTGLLAYTLVNTGLVEVIGSEQQRNWLTANEPHFKHSSLYFSNENAWETAIRFSPSFNPQEAEKRIRVIDGVHNAIEHCEEVFNEKVSSPEFETEWEKWVQGFKAILAELRNLSAGFTKESIVDLVVSSCAPKGFDPTIPIRDVISPKAIFYVGETNFYQPSATGITAMDVPLIDLTDESYQPGDRYREIASWRTYCNDDWKFHVSDRVHTQDLLRIGASMQIRQDVHLTAVSPAKIEPLPWDEELITIRRSYAPVEGLLSRLN